MASTIIDALILYMGYIQLHNPSLVINNAINIQK